WPLFNTVIFHRLHAPDRAWHALPWAVPPSGQKLAGQRLRTLLCFRGIPFVSIGTWHANCRKLCAHAKPVGEGGVRHLIPALPKQLRIKLPAPHPTVLRTARTAFNSACHSSQRL